MKIIKTKCPAKINLYLNVFISLSYSLLLYNLPIYISLKKINTIKNSNGKLKGYNTDVHGFLSGLNNLGELNKERPVIVLGAGGACEAVIYSLVKRGLNHIFLIYFLCQFCLIFYQL